MTLLIPERVAFRAATNCTEGDHGCLISRYSIASHGYAQVGWNQAGGVRSMTTAHRAAWVHHSGGQIPDGMTVDHLCHVRTCVNPKHLRLLSNYENARRTFGRDWPLGVCIRGHSNDELRRWSGRLRCRLCEQLKAQARRKAKQAT